MGSKGRKKKRRVGSVVDESRDYEQWWNEAYMKEFSKRAKLKPDFSEDFGFKVAMLVAVKAEPLKIKPELAARLAIGLYNDFFNMGAAGAKRALEEFRGSSEKPDPSAETKHGDPVSAASAAVEPDVRTDPQEG